MNTISRAGLTLVTGACFALVASPAAAHPDDHGGDGHQGDGGYDVVEAGEWTPADPALYEPLEFAACGDTVTIEGGDVRAAEERVSTLENGATLIEFRGQVTVDLTRHADGAMIDELDVSGVGSTLISADGTKVKDILFGASIMFPLFEAEVGPFVDAFGTDLAYFSDPEESVRIRLTTDPATGEVLDVRSIDVDAHIEDLCTWFDDDPRHHHDGDKYHDGDRRHHGDGHHRN